MCSRYSLTSPPEAVRAYFRCDNEAVFPPRYNIAPSQPVAIVRNKPQGGREMALVRWGLIPAWVKDPRAFKMLINARAESAVDKPSFRAAMRHRRCLIPADGFYEWKGAPGAKRPHLVKPRAGGPMALAGIFENWLGADGSEIETVAILTVAAMPQCRRCMTVCRRSLRRSISTLGSTAAWERRRRSRSCLSPRPRATSTSPR